MKIQDLKEYHKNPRKISAERFEQLGASLKELGDLGGIVVNRPTAEIIGGNQRVKEFLQERDHFQIEIVEEYEQPHKDGTVAVGFVLKDAGTPDEQRFSYREVIWTDKQCERANVVANKLTGFWDFDILANSFEMDDLLNFGFSKADLDLMPKPSLAEMDKNGLAKSMDSYLEGNIKQIVLYFKSEEFESAVARLDRAMADFGVESHTEAILALLDEHEQKVGSAIRSTEVSHEGDNPKEDPA